MLDQHCLDIRQDLERKIWIGYIKHLALFWINVLKSLAFRHCILNLHHVRANAGSTLPCQLGGAHNSIPQLSGLHTTYIPTNVWEVDTVSKTCFLAAIVSVGDLDMHSGLWCPAVNVNMAVFVVTLLLYMVCTRTAWGLDRYKLPNKKLLILCFVLNQLNPLMLKAVPCFLVFLL